MDKDFGILAECLKKHDDIIIPGIQNGQVATTGDKGHSNKINFIPGDEWTVNALIKEAERVAADKGEVIGKALLQAAINFGVEQNKINPSLKSKQIFRGVPFANIDVVKMLMPQYLLTSDGREIGEVSKVALPEMTKHVKSQSKLGNPYIPCFVGDGLQPDISSSNIVGLTFKQVSKTTFEEFIAEQGTVVYYGNYDLADKMDKFEQIRTMKGYLENLGRLMGVNNGHNSHVYDLLGIMADLYQVSFSVNKKATAQAKTPNEVVVVCIKELENVTMSQEFVAPNQMKMEIKGKDGKEPKVTVTKGPRI